MSLFTVRYTKNAFKKGFESIKSIRYLLDFTIDYLITGC